MKTITKTAAMLYAQENVELEERGQQYLVRRYDERTGMWREGSTKNYWEAKYFYAQAMLDSAAYYLDKPKINYNGGGWKKYMKKFN